MINSKNIKTNCHPEERSELRILPVLDDNREHWSDSEHTRLANDSTAGCLRMTNKLPRPLGEGWGEGRGEGAISKSTKMRAGRQHKINKKTKYEDM